VSQSGVAGGKRLAVDSASVVGETLAALVAVKLALLGARW